MFNQGKKYFVPLLVVSLVSNILLVYLVSPFLFLFQPVEDIFCPIGLCKVADHLPDLRILIFVGLVSMVSSYLIFKKYSKTWGKVLLLPSSFILILVILFLVVLSGGLSIG